MNYKVFIPCAGLGSRLRLKYNKALVTVGQKPAICHIIDKFPQEVELVIALGYDGDNIRQVLDLCYGDRKITYVNINPYEGEESGLGLTLLQCKDYLQSPFIFCSCDTIVKEDIPQPSYNWVGWDNWNEHLDNQYRHIRIIDNIVVEICSKNIQINNLTHYPYIGLCGIHDYELFWQSMEEGQEVGSIESGEVYGLKHLLNKNIVAKQFTWFDTGDPKSLEETRKHFPIDVNILPKDDEAIWFIGDNVVKFSIDKTFISDRVLRSADLEGYVPYVTKSSPNCYIYKKQEGKILSSQLTIKTFNYLLKHLTEFWQPVVLDVCYEIDSACKVFYKTKTTKRIKQYLKTFEQIDQVENINGIDIPSIWTILDKIDWNWLCKSAPTSRFHGDLHFENILIHDDDTFTFLDWRQSFSGLLGHGDIYYDLAKLNHGILISHELVNKELFSHSISDNVVQFDFLRKNISIELEKRLEEFVIEQGYDYRKVQYLTYLIFLNIAALHHYPYGLLLFHLGKLGLWKLLEEGKDMRRIV